MAEPIAHKSELTTEVLVIGSGPGGAVTATLCAEAGKSVLLIEEGDDLSAEPIPPFSHEELTRKYRNAGINIAFGAAQIAYVEGRTLGGGSEINRGIYHRTPDHLLEQWQRDFAVRELSGEALAAHFSACEATALVEHVPCNMPLMSTRLGAGAQALGWKSVAAKRLYKYGGAGDHRQTMSRTFVPRFRAAGGRLISRARAERVFRTSPGIGADVRMTSPDGRPKHVRVKAEHVFVACGAVHTPALLRRSGIRHNIGDSLRFHPMLKVVAEFDAPVHKPGDVDPVHQITEFEPRFSMGCSISTPSTLALALVNHPEQVARIPDEWPRMAIYYVQNSSGPATVRNLPGFRDPLVRVAQTKAELEGLAAGLKRLCEAVFAAGAVAAFPCLPGYPALHSLADVARLPDTLAPADCNAASVHVFSSCPMGENLAVCAADSFGRVHGAERLSIADASLLCTATVVNPQGTVMAIAHRNASSMIDSNFR